jgi:hypothetical protein
MLHVYNRCTDIKFLKSRIKIVLCINREYNVGKSTNCASFSQHKFLLIFITTDMCISLINLPVSQRLQNFLHSLRAFCVWEQNPTSWSKRAQSVDMSIQVSVCLVGAVNMDTCKLQTRARGNTQTSMNTHTRAHTHTHTHTRARIHTRTYGITVHVHVNNDIQWKQIKHSNFAN